MNPRSDARARTRQRLSLLLVLTIAICVGGVRLLHLYNKSIGSIFVTPSGKSDDNVVTLNNSVTMLAKRGTVARDIVDWLNSDETEDRRFYVGGHQFVDDTDVLTSQSLGRINRLALTLKAKKNVTIELISSSQASSNIKGTDRLTRARATAAERELVRTGVEPDRIKVSLKNGAPIDGDSPIAILLTKNHF